MRVINHFYVTQSSQLSLSPPLVPFQSVILDITSDDDLRYELGSRLEIRIHFECKLNEPMHIGMR